MMLDSLYILWGGITAIALICSTAELIDKKKKECDNTSYSCNRSDSLTKAIFACSLLSAIIFVVAGIMSFFLSLIYDKPQLTHIISILTVWPGVSFALAVIGVRLKMNPISKHKSNKVSTVLLAFSILSIVLYYCYFGYVLFSAPNQI